ncbi:MAG: DUF1990 family protein, partial [Terracidiphilus sp.]
MFHFTQPHAAAIERRLAAARRLPSSSPQFLSFNGGMEVHPPGGFAHDHSRSCIGRGEAAFTAAKRAFKQWAMFDLGWVRVANPSAPVA